MARKDSVVFYKEWYAAVSSLPVEQRCNIYEALFEYAFNGVSPDDLMTQVITATWRNRIDKDTESYLKTCSRNRENGSKGGRPRKTQQNPENPVVFSETQPNPTKPKKPDNDYDKDNDNDKDNDTHRLDKSNRECKPREPRVSEIEMVDNWVAEHQVSIPGLCKNMRITERELKEYAYAIVNEWIISGNTKNTIDESKGEFSSSHLINTIRIRSHANKRTNDENKQQADKLEQRRAIEPASKSATEYSESF